MFYVSPEHFIKKKYIRSFNYFLKQNISDYLFIVFVPVYQSIWAECIALYVLAAGYIITTVFLPLITALLGVSSQWTLNVSALWIMHLS